MSVQWIHADLARDKRHARKAILTASIPGTIHPPFHPWCIVKAHQKALVLCTALYSVPAGHHKSCSSECLYACRNTGSTVTNIHVPPTYGVVTMIDKDYVQQLLCNPTAYRLHTTCQLHHLSLVKVLFATQAGRLKQGPTRNGHKSTSGFTRIKIRC